MTTATTTKLEYVIGDYDTEDTYVFEVEGAPKGGLSVKWRLHGASDEGGPDLFAPDLLKSADGVFVLSQGSRAGELGWCPPFVVATSVRKQLAAGEVELRTGFEGDPLSVLRAELEELSAEAKQAANAYGAPVLAGKGGDGELVVSASEPAQLVWLRANDACTVAWRAGVLPGKSVKIAKAKAPKKKSAGPLDELRTASKAKRLAAAKKLAAAPDPTACDALLELGVSETDWQVSSELGFAFRGAVREGEKAGKPYDLLGAIRARLATTPDREEPAPGQRDGELTVLSWLLELAQRDDSPEATALLREVAWTRRLGHTRTAAVAMLVNRADPDSVDRTSRMLAEHEYDGYASRALWLLPAEVAVPRATATFDAGTEDQKRTWAHALVMAASGTSAGHLELLAHVAPWAGPNATRQISEWLVAAKIVENGRRDGLAAWALLQAFRWTEEHDAVAALLPDDAFDVRATTRLVTIAGNEPAESMKKLLMRAPIGVLLTAVREMIAIDWFITAPVIAAALAARRGEDAAVAATLEACAEAARSRGYVEQAAEMLAAL